MSVLHFTSFSVIVGNYLVTHFSLFFWGKIWKIKISPSFMILEEKGTAAITSLYIISSNGLDNWNGLTYHYTVLIDNIPFSQDTEMFIQRHNRNVITRSAPYDQNPLT